VPFAYRGSPTALLHNSKRDPGRTKDVGPVVQTFRTIVIDRAKLRYYCLSTSHPRGRHKSRVFRSRLGLTATDTELLRRALLEAVRDHHEDLRPAEHDRYGRRYVLEFEMATPKGTAIVRSTWIARVGEDVLRFVTCYVL
jgi:uncharacterized protein DUF6883